MPAMDVTVVGAGVIGCAIAHALARAGLRVGVIERDAIAAHASSAAAGMLAPIAEADANAALLEVGLAALEAFPAVAAELRETSGIDPQLVIRGLVRLHRSIAPQPAWSEAFAAIARDWKLERWEADDLRERLPFVSAEIEGATFSPREGAIHPGRLTRAYASAAERHYAGFELGVIAYGLLEANDRVVGIRTSSGERHSAHVVWCAGAWGGPDIEGWPAFPIEPVKGQMISLESQSLCGGPVIWDDDVYLVPHGDGLLRVGATSERVGFDDRPTAGGALQLLNAATRCVPELLRARFDSTWAGLRPMTPDGLPLVGAIPHRPGLHVALGHGRHGILLSELTARAIARSILHSAGVAAELAAFAPSRFTAG